jgi:hypothetical protein
MKTFTKQELAEKCNKEIQASLKKNQCVLSIQIQFGGWRARLVNWLIDGKIGIVIQAK